MEEQAAYSLAAAGPGASLPEISRRFILHWGEMGSRWGVNRTVAQIHALLFLTGRPMHAEEIADTLGIARSNASNSLRELMNLRIVSVVHRLGDRRDHFETYTDPWLLCRTIVRERKQREFDPTVAMLESCVAAPEFEQEDAGRQQRVRDTLALMRQLSSWADELLALEAPTLQKLLKVGGKVAPLLGVKPKKSR